MTFSRDLPAAHADRPESSAHWRLWGRDEVLSLQGDVISGTTEDAMRLRIRDAHALLRRFALYRGPTT